MLCVISSLEALVTLAVDTDVVWLGRGALAATVEEAHHHGVVLLVLQVVELGGKHIEQGDLLQQFVTVGRGAEELH